ncbi:hypothetical protein CYMTET_50877 [Cymbomonas tetramitiformis]|uniref:Uncharacterized protein n=1 Tax=Cymbomonas tetramitiformis TaxID=36881 RepID=A0AAE0ESD7_9CHLO|nr:hypothetical protein CYMTET_50877 [Cymbomonas tetramitiformis]
MTSVARVAKSRESHGGFSATRVSCNGTGTRVNASLAEAFPLEGVPLVKANGEELRLPSWGEEQTVVFALLRHFG